MRYALRSGHGPGRSRPADPAGRSSAHAAGHPAPHRHGRLVRGGLPARTRGAVQRVLAGAGRPVAGARAALRGLQPLAAALDGKRCAASAGRLLEDDAGGCARAVGAAHRPSASAAARVRRCAAGRDAGRHPDRRAESLEPAARHHPVHDAAGRLGGAAVQAVPPAGRGDRHRGRQSRTRGGRAADRLLRQHAGAAHRPGRRAERRRVAPAGEGACHRRAAARGHAVRARGRTDPPDAQPGAQPAVPGRLRVAEHAGGGADADRADGDAAAHGDAHHGQVRSHAGPAGNRRPHQRRHRVRHGPVRAGHHRTLRRVSAHPAAGHGGRHGEQRCAAGRPPAHAAAGRAATPAGRPRHRHRHGVPRGARHPPAATVRARGRAHPRRHRRGVRGADPDLRRTQPPRQPTRARPHRAGCRTRPLRRHRPAARARPDGGAARGAQVRRGLPAARSGLPAGSAGLHDRRCEAGAGDHPRGHRRAVAGRRGAIDAGRTGHPGTLVPHARHRPDGRASFAAAAAVASGLRDLHLRLDRPAQGRGDRAPQCRAPAARHRTPVPLRPRRCLDALPFLRLRLLGLGDLGRAGLRRPAGGGARAVRALAARLLRAAVPRGRDGSEPDAERLPAVDRGAGAQQRGAPAALHRVRRRGAGAAHAAAVDPAQRPRAHVPDQHVRDHRDHRARHLLPDRTRRHRSRRGQPHRHAARRPAHLSAGRGAGAGAGGRAGRAVHRRARPGARLSEPASADGRALHRQPVPHARHARHAPVQDRGRRQAAARRHLRIPRAQRRPGQDPRLPHRTGRDRGQAGRAARRARRRGAGARGPGRRQAAGRLPRARGGRRAARRDAARQPGQGTGRLHAAERLRDARRAAADGQRQARPQGAAGAAGRRLRPPRLRSAAGCDGDRAGGHLVGRAATRIDRPPRQLLRARRAFAAGGAPAVADPRCAAAGDAAEHPVQPPQPGRLCRGRGPDRPDRRDGDPARRPQRTAGAVVRPAAAVVPGADGGRQGQRGVSHSRRLQA